MKDTIRLFRINKITTGTIGLWVSIYCLQSKSQLITFTTYHHGNIMENCLIFLDKITFLIFFCTKIWYIYRYKQFHKMKINFNY
jgi:hypothetical protein